MPAEGRGLNYGAGTSEYRDLRSRLVVSCLESRSAPGPQGKLQLRGVRPRDVCFRSAVLVLDVD